MGAIAKRSAAMDRSDMPAPDFVGLGHGTQNRTATIIRGVMEH